MLSVGVLIDLLWQPQAGGHVKCWERFAEAAADLEDANLDLTLHFLGEQAQTIELSERVRYVLHRPLFDTARIPFLQGVADRTDLAPISFSLLPSLKQYDVVHATHPLFAFGKTALQYARWRKVPLIASIHTDVPAYTEIYTAQILQRLLGEGWVSRWLIDRWQFPQQRRAAMGKQLRHYWQHCDRVLASQPADYQQVVQLISAERAGYLRRGIDLRLFQPHLRDRDRLQQTYGLDPDTFVLLFVGRLDPCKRVSIVAEATRLLRDRGLPVRALFVGKGNSAAEIQALLGSTAILAGTIPHDELGWIYASADAFVFPSDTETYGNVVLEAKACGTPVLVANRGGAAQLVKQPGWDGLRLDSNRPADWADDLLPLIEHPEKRQAMGQAARQQIDEEWPSWQQVLQRDLLPVWRAVANQK